MTFETGSRSASYVLSICSAASQHSQVTEERLVRLLHHVGPTDLQVLGHQGGTLLHFLAHTLALQYISQACHRTVQPLQLEHVSESS